MLPKIVSKAGEGVRKAVEAQIPEDVKGAFERMRNFRLVNPMDALRERISLIRERGMEVLSLFKDETKEKLDEISHGIRELKDETVSKLEETKTITQQKLEDVVEKLLGIYKALVDKFRFDKEVIREQKEARLEAAFEGRRVTSPLGFSVAPDEENESFWSSIMSGTTVGHIAGAGIRKAASSRAVQGILQNGFVRLVGSIIRTAFSLSLKSLVVVLPSIISSRKLAEKLGVEQDWTVFISDMIGGAEKGLTNAFVQGGLWAAQGALMGMPFGPVGILIGGLLGAAFGGIMGYIGGERIYRWIKDAEKVVKEGYGQIKKAILDFTSKLIGGVKSTVDFVFGTTFNLNEEERRKVEEHRKRIRELDTRILELQKERQRLLQAYMDAVRRGDEGELSVLRQKLANVNDSIRKLVDERQAEVRKVDEVHDTLMGRLRAFKDSVNATVLEYAGKVANFDFKKFLEEKKEDLKDLKDRIVGSVFGAIKSVTDAIKKRIGLSLDDKELKKIADTLMAPIRAVRKAVAKILSFLPESYRPEWVNKELQSDKATIKRGEVRNEALRKLQALEGEIRLNASGGKVVVLPDFRSIRREGMKVDLNADITRLERYLQSLERQQHQGSPGNVSNANIITNNNQNVRNTFSIKTTPMDSDPSLLLKQKMLHGVR